MTAPSPPAATATVASPCTGVCRIDERSGWCAGCLRTLDEIATWGAADDAQRSAVWHAIAQRREGTGG